MPRPTKWRRVCALPKNQKFGPLNQNFLQEDFIVMSVEEFETIRLIDYEGLMQEECAIRMNVARTTVQRIYNNARAKIAKSMVEGKALSIEGGNYKLCTNRNNTCGIGNCYMYGRNGNGPLRNGYRSTQGDFNKVQGRGPKNF